MSMSLAIAEAAQSAAQNVVYLAGVGGDGTNNGAVTAIVNRAVGFVSVVLVAVFAIRALLAFAKSKGAEGYKELFAVGGQFAIVMVLVLGAWGIARVAASMGFFS